MLEIKKEEIISQGLQIIEGLLQLIENGGDNEQLIKVAKAHLKEHTSNND